ncbi:hypothetical protein MAMP_00039 [Methylophaga aminisulfidivorans MP]|uniref:PA2779 family protein n=1 Tax=Methylophaga aminisulfidivorans MP TaxID=1026882 RepID=F5SXV7_9GAMM|nr:PA2779 family protein [Methylophaga aminisulfidivorans]EGL54025.1 hypothetical protein MAMP_00039 [Methylophaga aminisulfidivorans MP]
MDFFRRLNKVIPVLSIMAFLSIYMAPVHAAMIDNQQLITQSQSDITKQEVLQQLDRQEVKQQLLSMGVDLNDAKARINQMSDQELAQLAQNFDEMPAGSGIIGAILVVFIVLVITDMLGATDVFGFVHDINH